MKRVILSLITASLALSACSQSPSNEPSQVTTSVNGATQEKLEELKTIRQYNKAVYKERGRDACFAALHGQVAETDNLENSIKNEKSATFEMSTSEGNLTSGSMTWYATIETFRGIPWEHEIYCTADVSSEPARVTYLHAKVPLLEN